MPNVLPTIPNDPPQGIQALLDKVYLWNPDVSNELIEKINALLAKLGDAIGAIRPYSELVAPISQYEPCYYGSGVYVASRELTEVPAEFNEVDWILIATKGVTAEEAAETYLPLSGGEMTGLLTLNATEKPQYFFQSAPLLQIKAETADGTTKLNKNIQITPGGILNMDGLSLSSTGSISCMPTGDYDIGSQTIKWRRVYATILNNGADLTVPTEGGTLARVEDINAIGGVGTAGQVLTKTENGIAWQDAAGGSSLPDQTDNAGKFLTTDGTTASWGNALASTAKSNLSLCIGGNDTTSGQPFSVWIGFNSGPENDYASNSLAVGNYAKAGSTAVALGAASSAKNNSISIGYYAVSTYNAIQLGGGTNNDENTFKVSNSNGNFEMMDANGNIPLERLTYVTNQIGDISTALTAILGE